MSCGYINKPKPSPKEALPVPPVPPQQSGTVAAGDEDDEEDLVDDAIIQSYNSARISAISATAKRKRPAAIVKKVDGSDAERVLREVYIARCCAVVCCDDCLK